MILSLFKVALLTLSTSLFSFPNGTSSQKKDLVPQTERNLFSPNIENTYVQYDEENDYESIEYVDILVSDTQTTYFDGLFSSSQTALSCPSDCIGYKLNGVWFDDDDLWSGAGRFNLSIDNKTFTWSDYRGYNYYRINFVNHTIYRDIGNGIQQLDGIRIKNIPVNQTYSYTAWLSVAFIPYIQQNPYYLTEYFSLSNLVNYKYVNVADFFFTYQGSADSQIIFQWSINSAGCEYQSSDIVVWVDENSINLTCSGENKGVFILYDSYSYLYESLTIKYTNSNIGLAFYEALQKDIALFSPVENVTFTFSQWWNQNAPFHYSRESYLVYSSGTFDADHINVEINISMPLFVVDGYDGGTSRTFNGIRLLYKNAYNEYSINESGDVYRVEQQGFGQFLEMDYFNFGRDDSLLVCYSLHGNSEDSGGVMRYYRTNQTQWLNDTYRTIKFIQPVSDSDIGQLTPFNSNVSGNGITVGENYLSSAFSLIGNAFSGLRSFMGIVVLPGITLGTLIIIPLAITLLFFVIRLFKR